MVMAELDGNDKLYTPNEELYSDCKQIPKLKHRIESATALTDDNDLAQARVQDYMLECVLKGDWQQVWKCLHIFYHARVCHVKKQYRPRWSEIWQIGSEAMRHLHKKMELDRPVFFREVSKHSSHCRHHVIAELILHLIAEGNLKEAYFVSKSPVAPRSKLASPDLLKLESEWQRRIKALSGMMAYILWLKEEDDHESILKIHFSQSASNRKTQLAKEAIENFQEVTKTPGVWDIFIIKEVQLLEYLDQSHIAQERLKEYWEKNPQNPNAPKYLYRFMVSSGSPPSDLLPVLKDIVSHQPFDPLVVDYVQLLQHSCPSDDQASPAACLNLLFSLLDYPSSGEELSAWNLLTRNLRNLLKNNQTPLNTVAILWKSRRSWWPLQYFSSKGVKALLKGSPKLVTARAVAAIYLEGPDCRFVTKVEGWLQKHMELKLQRKLEKAKKVPCLAAVVNLEET
ncbi:TATA box-binding protein-associated factor RNA polymerase I subunit A [Holothuria leucospilota]|uniref:TATA box-binding protein-associated factor RNA polymerase I subunit A n=1 Tax=Holothuria leucospilota TaxID=206669 RepID=A0A9Q1CH34_HOLLE|nr:TATA box-binding protein-associated factor RNA polymerase I subunit A [Holothuria leucospilota]